MSIENRKDPFTVFKFGLEIKHLKLDLGQAFFKSVSGLKAEVEATDQLVGGENGFVRKLLGRVKYPPLVLKNGFTGDIRFSQTLFTILGENPYTRFDGAIYHYGASKSVVSVYNFVNAAMVKWELSELDAGKNELAIETIELIHEGLTIETPAAAT